jgi:hypothetical protein
MKVRIVNGAPGHEWTGLRAARHLVDERGCARWIVRNQSIELIESDHRVRHTAGHRALYCAGMMHMALPDELRGIPCVGDVMRAYY